MGVDVHRGNLRQMSSYISRIPYELVNDIEEDVAKETAQEGAELMRDLIRTRGTSRSGKEGRIETGMMLKRVRYRVDRISGGRIRIQWGWLSDRRAYFRYQENGFRHYRSGRDVEPMHALLDSYMMMTDRFVDKMRQRFR